MQQQMQACRHCICWLSRSCLPSQALEKLNYAASKLHGGLSWNAQQHSWDAQNVGKVGPAGHACRRITEICILCSRSDAPHCADLLCCSQSCPDSPGITCSHAAAGPGTGRTSASKRLQASLRLCRRLQAESCRLGSVPIIGFMWNGPSCWSLSVSVLCFKGTAITGSLHMEDPLCPWLMIM